MAVLKDGAETYLGLVIEPLFELYPTGKAAIASTTCSNAAWTGAQILSRIVSMSPLLLDSLQAIAIELRALHANAVRREQTI